MYDITVVMYDISIWQKNNEASIYLIEVKIATLT